MSYHISTTVKELGFEEVIEKVGAVLKEEGFGILTEIDIQAALKKKINVDFKKYKILGACNPEYAHKALLAEDKIGVFLPCNIIVTENVNGEIEVSAVDPVASMVAVENSALETFGLEVKQKLENVISKL